MTKEQVIRRAAKDLLFFGRAVVPTLFTTKSAAFHFHLAKHLMDTTIRRLNIIAPRGHAKSSIVACLFVLWHIVFHRAADGKAGHVFIVLVSKTQDHAVKLLQTIKDVLEFSQHFRALFGYWGQHVAKSWKRHEVELVDPRDPSRVICITCRGAAQQLRGLKYIHQRPTLVIYDDPEDEENTKTDDRLDTNLIGLLKGIVPGLDAKYGRVVVIGTPIHSRGMVNTLEETAGWVTLKYRALNDRTDLSPEELAELPEAERYVALWPEVWPVEKLLQERQAMEDIGKLSVFYSEFQCEIVGDADALFDKRTFRYWSGELKWDANREAYLEATALSTPESDLEPCVGPDGTPKPTLIPVNVFMGIDPASSTKARADYSCIFVVAVDKDLNVYCIDYFRKRVKPMQLAEAIVTMYRKYRPKKTQIETVGYQEMLRDYLRTHVPDHIPGLEIKNDPRRGKTERLESLQPEFASGKIYLKPTMSVFMDELLLFPRGKHDDTLDAFFYARKGAYRPYHDVIAEQTESIDHYGVEVLDWMVV